MFRFKNIPVDPEACIPFNKTRQLIQFLIDGMKYVWGGGLTNKKPDWPVKEFCDLQNWPLLYV